MRRNFKLLAYRRIDNTLLSERELEKVTAPSGFGFKQKVIVQETDTVDYVVNQILKKKPIKLQVSFIEPDAYAKAEAFQTWLGKYIDLREFKLVLKYNNGLNDRYVDVFVEDYELIALQARVVSVQLTIQPLTPNYLARMQTVTIATSDTHKSYPYTYPYKYGGGVLENAELTNTFISLIPLAVTFRGKIVNPECTLIDENNVAYATIKFSGITLQAGQKLIVDGINQRITFFANEDDEEGIDYFNEINKNENTFLRLKPGTSSIAVNLDSNEASNPSVEISYLQYLV